MKHLLPIYLIIITLISCKQPDINKFLESGVSLELARHRYANYTNIRYNLSFSIPENKTLPVTGEAEISLIKTGKAPLILDFTGAPEQISTVTLNGTPVEYTLENQHIVIPARAITNGENIVSVVFTCNDQSLNRREEFLYTLLVPDRARTLFPCFDQPDLKAAFTLTLEIPETWVAVGNGSILSETLEQGRKLVKFKASDPVSTYLFSFVTGHFERLTETRDGRSVSLYHRETDPVKVAQCGDIFSEVFHSLAWLEDYTAIPYPFEKYDLIILPGFQYGGMEHTGATLYNDRRMFLEPNATLSEMLGRSSLIAHETAHMWFGDYVTMKWFNDVWNKEVFANWFAALIVEPMYPNINHDLNFILSYYPSAYSEDRTKGARPIQQHLGNLRDAGLIYSSIVYNKSPLVMEMLVRKVGEERFRDGIRQYLRTYAYGNADWDDLIAILDGLTDEDLRTWSDTWVKEKGMPFYTCKVDGRKLTVTQTDPWKRGILWSQPIQFTAVSASGSTETLEAEITQATTEIDLPFDISYILPNTNGRAYGYFRMSDVPAGLEALLKTEKNEVSRMALLMNYYETLLANNYDAESFLYPVLNHLSEENNLLIFRQALSYAGNCKRLFASNLSDNKQYEDILYDLATRGKNIENRIHATRAFYNMASSDASWQLLKKLWTQEDYRKQLNITLNESDLIALSYQLAIRFPEEATTITTKQLARISNPDRRKEYGFVSRAVAADKAGRDAFFRSLMLKQNREIEPWVLSALRLLNHPLREKEALEYIRPGLDVLQEIQRTGDIFFPANWCKALLDGHSSHAAIDTVERFFADNPGYPDLLSGKIWLSADDLFIRERLTGLRY